jgi:HSP20 family molecular chaperone IbpA
MRLKQFLSGEPSLTREILAGLRTPLVSPHRTATISSDDYDVEIGEDYTLYRMIVAGRGEEEISIEAQDQMLIVKSDHTDWLPAQQFVFGLPPNPAEFTAELADGVLTIRVEHAKPAGKEGKITITKRR